MAELKDPQREALRAFIQEIRALQAEEQDRKTSAHFSDPEFNPENLEPADAEIWTEIKAGTITREGLRAYRAGIDRQNRSRIVFGEFAENKAAPAFIRKEIVEKARQEIQELIQSTQDPHFEWIKPELLAEEELILWDELQGVRSQEDLDEYMERYNPYASRMDESYRTLSKEGKNPEQDTRVVFKAWLANKINSKIADLY